MPWLVDKRVSDSAQRVSSVVAALVQPYSSEFNRGLQACTGNDRRAARVDGRHGIT